MTDNIRNYILYFLKEINECDGLSGKKKIYICQLTTVLVYLLSYQLNEYKTCCPSN